MTSVGGPPAPSLTRGNRIRSDETELATRHLQDHRELHMALHGAEIESLAPLAAAGQLAIAEHNYARSLRENKFDVRLSEFGFELMMRFLKEKKMLPLLSIINQYVSITVAEQGPGGAGAELTGVPARVAADMGARRLIMGSPDPDVALRDAIAAFNSQQAAVEAASQGGARGRPMRAAELGVGGTEHTMPPPGDEDEAETRVPLVQMTSTTQAAVFSDLVNALALDAHSLPSCAMYTFLNTRNTLNALEVSRDASVVAAGFSNSAIKVWDMNDAVRSGRVRSASPLAVCILCY